MKTDFWISERQIILSPVTPEAEGFLYRVYASTRAAEMALVAWTDEQKQAFLWQQFTAQTQHYLTYYPQAEYYLICRDDVAMGRLILNYAEQQLVVIDIALLPEFRNTGLGTAILNKLMEEARQKGLSIVLRVEFFNPALRLYTRLGFVKTREVNSVYYELVWTPVVPQATSTPGSDLSK